MAKGLFGTDGIRGVAGVDLTPALATSVAQAAGLVFAGHGGKPALAIIGKDTRLSGYMIEAALVAGLVSVGVEVLQVGPIPTPGLAMLVRAMRGDFGIMVTASHNHYRDNGIKFFGPDGYKLSDAKESDIEALAVASASKRTWTGDIGRARRIDDAQGRYIEAAKATIPKGLELTGLRVVIDCAHGAAYRVAPTALRELGAEVIAIGVEPNGTNINDGCGSTSPQQLVSMVRERRADIGIGLDGDADRVILVDEKGNLIDGDHILATIATHWQTSKRFKKPLVVGTVMSNFALAEYFKGRNITFKRSAVGDRYVLEQMRTLKAHLGGEPSGHIILAEHATTGDGLIAALQVLAIAQKRGRPISEVCHLFTPTPQCLMSVRYEGKDPLTIGRVKDAIKSGEEQLGERGRVLVRLSGTEPVVRVMAEGPSDAEVRAIVEEICATIVSSCS